MQINLKQLVLPNQTIAVAVSGGSDSVALLHYMLSVAELLNISVIALNVEHGIRGKESEKDSDFVKSLCAKWGVKLLSYKVDSLKKSQEDKLSLEQAARVLRYQCFFDAINNGECDKVATAHHSRDNLESVLLNLFRGSGLSGVSGILSNYNDKIIRPFLSISKEEIDEYVCKNCLPFVIDQTNFNTDFTRNHIRLNILPEIKKVFPEVEKSVFRFTEIVKSENEYLQQQALAAVQIDKDKVKISLPLHPVLLARASVHALKVLNITKDWEKAHIDSIISLADGRNGAKINLKSGIVVSKEYDVLTFYRHTEKEQTEIAFSLGQISIGKKTVVIEKCAALRDLTTGFYADLDKIPSNAVLRFKRDGDLFTKFGGGTKPLGEYLTDKKIPLRERDFIPLIAVDKVVLAIFNVAISDKIKVDKTTKNIIKFSTKEHDYEQELKNNTH